MEFIKTTRKERVQHKIGDEIDYEKYFKYCRSKVRQLVKEHRAITKPKNKSVAGKSGKGAKRLRQNEYLVKEIKKETLQGSQEVSQENIDVQDGDDKEEEDDADKQSTDILANAKHSKKIEYLFFVSERNWAYGQQLKEMYGKTEEPRVRYHMIRRYKAAVKTSQLIIQVLQASLQEKKQKNQTRLNDARVYYCGLKGVLEFEQENWKEAIKAFSAYIGGKKKVLESDFKHRATGSAQSKKSKKAGKGGESEKDEGVDIAGMVKYAAYKLGLFGAKKAKKEMTTDEIIEYGNAEISGGKKDCIYELYSYIISKDDQKEDDVEQEKHEEEGEKSKVQYERKVIGTEKKSGKEMLEIYKDIMDKLSGAENVEGEDKIMGLVVSMQSSKNNKEYRLHIKSIIENFYKLLETFLGFVCSVNGGEKDYRLAIQQVLNVKNMLLSGAKSGGKGDNKGGKDNGDKRKYTLKKIILSLDNIEFHIISMGGNNSRSDIVKMVRKLKDVMISVHKLVTVRDGSHVKYIQSMINHLSSFESMSDNSGNDHSVLFGDIQQFITETLLQLKKDGLEYLQVCRLALSNTPFTDTPGNKIEAEVVVVPMRPVFYNLAESYIIDQSASIDELSSLLSSASTSTTAVNAKKKKSVAEKAVEQPVEKRGSKGLLSSWWS